MAKTLWLQQFVFLCKWALSGTSAGPTLPDVVPDVHLQLLHALVHLGCQLLLLIAVDDCDTWGDESTQTHKTLGGGRVSPAAPLHSLTDNDAGNEQEHQQYQGPASSLEGHSHRLQPKLDLSKTHD